MAYTCSKTFLTILNGLLITFGIVLILLSIYVYHKHNSAQMIIGVIVIAFFVLIIGILGLIGALKQSKCALFLYIILVGMITLGLIALLVTFCIKRQWLIEKVIDSYENYLNSSKIVDNENNRHVARLALIKMECCGFKQTNKPNIIFDEIDFCKNISGITTVQLLCDEKIQYELQHNLVAIIVILALLASIGILACLVAIYLACTTDKLRRVRTRYH